MQFSTVSIIFTLAAGAFATAIPQEDVASDVTAEVTAVINCQIGDTDREAAILACDICKRIAIEIVSPPKNIIKKKDLF